MMDMMVRIGHDGTNGHLREDGTNGHLRIAERTSPQYGATMG